MWIKTNNSAKNIPLLLGLFAILTWSPITVCASEIPDTSTEDELLLMAENIEPAVFSVTVPTSLPLYVDGYGSITTASNAQIINNSNSSVRVVDMSITPTGAYNIKSYDEDFTNKYVNSYEMALNINGSKTQNDGAFGFDAVGFPAIQAGDSQTLDYMAKVTGTSERIDSAHVADVYITIDWSGPVEVTYNARGGLFADGNDTNVITYTDSGKIISGTLRVPTKPNCEFEGWYTDENFTTKVEGNFAPTSDITLYARWKVPYTVRHLVQSLDNSYIYNIQDTDSLMGLEGETVWPETKTYELYDSPAPASLVISGNGDSILEYRYERTNFWLDVNFIIDGVETGGPGDGDAWPSHLTESFLYVYVDGWLVGGGRDYCNTHPVGSSYSVEVNLPEGYSYVGTYNEGYDEWNDGTLLYRHPASGTITENIGIRLIINTVTADSNCYYINFDANGGEGEMPPMTMVFGDDFTESEQIDWCSFTRDGYWFNGWSLSPNSTTPDFADCATISGLSSTNGETITLYAVWIPYEWFGLIPPEEDEMVEDEIIDDNELADNPEEEEQPDDAVDDSLDESDENESQEPPNDTPDDEPNDEDQSNAPDDSDSTETPETSDDESSPEDDSFEDPPANEDVEPGPPSDESDDEETTDEGVDNSDNETNEDENSPEPSENEEFPVVPEEDIEASEPEFEVTPDDNESETDEEQANPPEESETEKPNEPGEDEQEEPEEEIVVEPVYYCGFEQHIHGEDCAGLPCDEVEHEHTSVCLIPQPPKEEPPEQPTEPEVPDDVVDEIEEPDNTTPPVEEIIPPEKEEEPTPSPEPEPEPEIEEDVEPETPPEEPSPPPEPPVESIPEPPVEIEE